MPSPSEILNGRGGVYIASGTAFLLGSSLASKVGRGEIPWTPVAFMVACALFFGLAAWRWPRWLAAFLMSALVIALGCWHGGVLPLHGLLLGIWMMGAGAYAGFLASGLRRR